MKNTSMGKWEYPRREIVKSILLRIYLPILLILFFIFFIHIYDTIMENENETILLAMSLFLLLFLALLSIIFFIYKKIQFISINLCFNPEYFHRVLEKKLQKENIEIECKKDSFNDLTAHLEKVDVTSVHSFCYCPKINTWILILYPDDPQRSNEYIIALRPFNYKNKNNIHMIKNIINDYFSHDIQ